MKKLFIFLLATICLAQAVIFPPVLAADSDSPRTSTVEMLEDGYYLETIIEDAISPSSPVSRSEIQYVTKTKTTQLKNSSGVVLWSVSITATFAYDGSSICCMSYTPSAKAYASTWSIKNVTSSSNGIAATATATATQTYALGISKDYTVSVTIECSVNGVVS